MATFGIEGIRNFANLRASGISDVGDVIFTFNVCNGLDDELRAAGHSRLFYWAQTDCFELDLRDVSNAGIDNNWSDSVDLFFIITHGSFRGGRGTLLYDTPVTRWRGDQNDYRLGDVNLEWILVYGCRTINVDNPSHLWSVFQRLHEFCGSYGDMWDTITTDECGEDVGHNLTNGLTVCESWIDGVSDWWVDNHPVVVAMERAATFNGGNFDWPNTTLDRDHFWGHGTTAADILPAQKFWLSWQWSEG